MAYPKSEPRYRKADGLYSLEQMDEHLVRALDRLELSYRAAEEEIGVSAATLHRVAHGYRPDVESYLRIKLWLGLVKNKRLARSDARPAVHA